MMHPLDIHWVYTFGSVALIAGASFTGMLALSFSPRRLSRVIPNLVSIAAGALLGTAFGHLLPESIEEIGPGKELSALLLASFATLFLVEKAVRRCWDSSEDNVADAHQHGHADLSIKQAEKMLTSGNRSMVTNLLFGAAIHSFVDGMAIAAAYSAGTRLGLITSVAVLLHEAPHHIGDVGVLIHKGIPVMRAVFLEIVVGSVAAIGALFVLLVGTETMGVTSILLPFTTANFIYIATVSLMPELHRERGLRQSLTQIGFFLLGCLLMFASSSMSES